MGDKTVGSIRAGSISELMTKWQIPHTDDVAVDRFAWRMKQKLAEARSKGRGGWETCPEPVLLAMLRDHVEKGDMCDVANLAMMIHLNREASATGAE